VDYCGKNGIYEYRISYCLLSLILLHELIWLRQQIFKRPSQNFRIHDLHSKSIQIESGCSVVSARELAASGVLITAHNRNYRTIDPSAMQCTPPMKNRFAFRSAVHHQTAMPVNFGAQ
jgi:hypothetical protein